MVNGMQAGKWYYSEEELEKMHEEAVKRGAENRRTEIRALSARYDRETNQLILELNNATVFIVPCDLLQGLADAAPDLLSEVELWSDGTALHWEKLDADFLVAPLLQGIFGGKTWMENLPQRLSKIQKKSNTQGKKVA